MLLFAALRLCLEFAVTKNGGGEAKPHLLSGIIVWSYAKTDCASLSNDRNE